MRLKVVKAIKKKSKNQRVHRYLMMKLKTAKRSLKRRLKSCVNKAVSIHLPFKCVQIFVSFYVVNWKKFHDIVVFIILDGLNSSSEDNLLGTSVKQEPLSDDECHSEDGYAYDGDNDPFDEEDTFVHSNIFIPLFVFWFIHWATELLTMFKCFRWLWWQW